jgi:hypothetical protein
VSDDAEQVEQAGPRLRIEGQATPEEVAAVTAAVTLLLASSGEPAPEHESGWVVAARLEAQGHPPISTLRHIAAHATTH